jgi:hypothetical protein
MVDMFGFLSTSCVLDGFMRNPTDEVDLGLSSFFHALKVETGTSGADDDLCVRAVVKRRAVRY